MGHASSSEVVVTTALIAASEASSSFKCKEVGSGSSVGLAIAWVSFHHIFFGHEASIPTRNSDDKRCPQMASFLASDQASFIKSAGDPEGVESVSLEVFRFAQHDRTLLCGKS